MGDLRLLVRSLVPTGQAAGGIFRGSSLGPRDPLVEVVNVLGPR